jgi:hypothetical protein
MNIIISQYLYPFSSCMGGLLILYLCSNSSSVKKLKDMTYELTKEIEYLRKENLKKEKSYADNLQNTENTYQNKIKELEKKISTIINNDNVLSQDCNQNLIKILYNDSISDKEIIEECKTLIDAESYIFD